jgi:iron complex outermembrane receptor protein
VGAIDESESLFFFNPKIGAAYRFNEIHRLYAYFGIAGKEPTRDEYVNSSIQSRPSPETLYNIETGYKAEFNSFFVGINSYAMIYKDQLILTGQVNDVGEYIRQNVPDSYRLGLELESGVRLSSSIELAANATLSRNKIDEFSEFIDDYDNGGQIVRNFENTDIAFSPNFMGNAFLKFNKNGFSSEWISKYVSKQYLDNTQSDSRSLDAYFINNVRLAYTFSNLNFARSISANLLVNNVFNNTYETNGYTFGFIAGGEQRFNYYYPQAGTNFLFQVNWNF